MDDEKDLCPKRGHIKIDSCEKVKDYVVHCTASATGKNLEIL